ncbi:MAG TPA: histidine kinase dimerization/phospho-acceptor domain-containing protein, partial [Microvirga sp.]|nr:histidine kinase dimerization/phospho-acceptor domain-containing protein [Microvirga sp.]
RSGRPFIARANPVVLQRTPNGAPELGYFDFVLQPIVDADGSVSGVFLQGHEVTDQKRVEEELRTANAQAEAASRAKSEFLAAMSHEIRTPLTGILGMADLLGADELNSKQKGFVEAIRVSGRHLLNIINDILDFSRIETGKLELEHIDFSLPQVVEQLRSLVHPQVIERGLELRLELSEHSPPILKGDPYCATI